MISSFECDKISTNSAGVAGKCPELCYATQNVPCCNGVSSTSSFTVCNYDGVSHVYSYGLSTINGGPGCSAVGPTSFTPNTGTVTVPAAGCVTVPLIIGCPTNIPIGQVACYQVSLFNHDTGRLFACRGSVTRPNKWCLKWQLSDPVDVTGIVALDEAHATTMNIKATNLERTFSGPLDYQIRAFAGVVEGCVDWNLGQGACLCPAAADVFLGERFVAEILE